VLELREGGFCRNSTSSPLRSTASPEGPKLLSTKLRWRLLLCNSSADAARPYHEFVTLSLPERSISKPAARCKPLWTS